MKIIKKILIVLVALIVIAAIAGMFMSSKFSLERSIVINANEQVIFDQVNILKNWEKWSPWQKMDPTSKMTYFGPESGVGAGYEWAGEDEQTGSGTLTISESVPNQKVTTDLDFKENGKGVSSFILEKGEGGVKLSWTFDSDAGSNPFKKLMMNMLGKSFMNKTYDEGLNAIKSIAESMPAPSSEPVPMDSTAVISADTAAVMK